MAGPAAGLRARARARAEALARRWAIGALERIVREVDRLAGALEPVRALREAAGGEIEVLRRGELIVDVSGLVAGRRGAVGWAGDGRVVAEAAGAKGLGLPIDDAPSTAPHVTSPVVAEVGDDEDEPDEAGNDQTKAERPTASRGSATEEISPGVALANHLRARLEPQLTALRSAATWEQTGDPVEALHRARVATRRLRAFTSVFAPVVGDKRAKALTRRLREITRGLGVRREWDVLLQMLRAEHAKADPLTRAALEHVMAWAEEQRGKAARKARKALAKVDVGALADALDGELDRVCGRVLRMDEELPAEAKTWLDAELRRAFDGMPQPQREDEVEPLHEVRKRAKRVRYAVELLRPVRDRSLWALRRNAKGLQRALGTHHDLAMLLHHIQGRRTHVEHQGLELLASALGSAESELGHRRRRAHQTAQLLLARFELIPCKNFTYLQSTD